MGFCFEGKSLARICYFIFLLFYLFFGGGIEGGNNLLPQSKLTVTVNVRKRNLKAEENILVRLRKLAPSRNLVYTGTSHMDIDTDISVCKTPVVDEKCWFFEVESQLGKSLKVSVQTFIRRRTHSHKNL